MLKKTYAKLEPGFSPWAERVFDYTEYLSLKGLPLEPGNEKKRKRVFYHSPCHSLYELQHKDKPKKVLEAAGYFPLSEEEPLSCCGFCGVFSLKNPELSARLWERKKEKILSSQARILANTVGRGISLMPKRLDNLFVILLKKCLQRVSVGHIDLLGYAKGWFDNRRQAGIAQALIKICHGDRDDTRFRIHACGE